MNKRINRLPKTFVPLSPPYLTIKEEREVSKVLRSGILSLGPYIRLFEQSISRYIGTAGLHLSLIASGIKAGDEVLTSPFSFIASANVILYAQAKPVFVDIDPVTLNIDPKKIESAITKKTKAILPVHIFGYPIDYDAILEIAKKYKLKVIEDACEALGAKYNGRQVGSFNNLSVFAFYPNKQITTGEGGMVVTNNKLVFLLLKSLLNQGRIGSDQWLAHDKLGFNYRMDEMSAALGYVQMKKINYILTSRKKSSVLYARYLKDLKEISFLAKDNNKFQRSWQTFLIFLSGVSRNRVMEILVSRGIQCKPYLPSVHLQPYWRKAFKYKLGMFPVSEGVSRSSLALPLFTDMSKSMIVKVCNELERAIKIAKKEK